MLIQATVFIMTGYTGIRQVSQLLTYGISKNWIDMSSLTSEKYTSLQESYDALVDYIISALDSDTAFLRKCTNI